MDLPLLSNEPATILCSLDEQSYTVCGQGLRGRFTAQNLAEGPHELKVKATDEAGNEADPISLKWNSGTFSDNILPRAKIYVAETCILNPLYLDYDSFF